MARKRAVTLLWYGKTSLGWKRVPPVTSANGRIKHGWATVAGKPEHCPEGRYQLRFYVGRKLVYENAGDNAADAQAALQRKGFLLEARDLAAGAGVRVVEDEKRRPIRKAVDDYIRDGIAQGKTEAPIASRLTLNEFLEVTSKAFVDEISRDDALQFHSALRKRGLSDRTVANKDARLRSFLRFCGVNTQTLLPPRPKFEAKLPTVYSKEEIAAILKVADDYMRLVIELGLKCGLREQEIVHLEWADLDFAENVLRVRSKPLHGFRVKDSEERDLPVPKDLMERLQQWKGEKKSGLVLSGKSGGPERKLLRKLKRLAREADLHCKACDGCEGDKQECQGWQLHKLRRTYGTTLLRNGVDIATVQKFMGHSDPESTMRYLRPATAKESHAQINSIKWD